MNSLFNGRLKYLFLLPIVLMIGFVLFYQYALEGVLQNALNEKMVEKRTEVDLMAITAEELARNPHADSDTAIINAMIEKVDKDAGVFATRYDEHLNFISTRYYSEAEPFDPIPNTDFMQSIQHNDSGNIEIPYNNGKVIYPMMLYYRWVPDDSEGGRSLLVVGCTKDAVISKPEGMITVGMLILIIVTFIVNMAFVILLCYLGGIYSHRRGDKWRKVNVEEKANE